MTLDALHFDLAHLRPGGRLRVATYQTDELARRALANASLNTDEWVTRGFFGPHTEFVFRVEPIWKATCGGSISTCSLVAERVETRRLPGVSLAEWHELGSGE